MDTSEVMAEDLNGTLVISEDQRMFADDESGAIKVALKATNIGNKPAYYTRFSVLLSEDVYMLEDMLNEIPYTITQEGTQAKVTLDTNITFGAGESYTEIIYIRFNKTGTRRMLNDATISRTFIEKMYANIDLTSAPGTSTVLQAIVTPLKLALLAKERQ